MDKAYKLYVNIEFFKEIIDVLPPSELKKHMQAYFDNNEKYAYDFFHTLKNVHSEEEIAKLIETIQVLSSNHYYDTIIEYLSDFYPVNKEIANDFKKENLSNKEVVQKMLKEPVECLVSFIEKHFKNNGILEDGDYIYTLAKDINEKSMKKMFHLVVLN